MRGSAAARRGLPPLPLGEGRGEGGRDTSSILVWATKTFTPSLVAAPLRWLHPDPQSNNLAMHHFNPSTR